jgi:hypothetical protein
MLLRPYGIVRRRAILRQAYYAGKRRSQATAPPVPSPRGPAAPTPPQAPSP